MSALPVADRWPARPTPSSVTVTESVPAEAVTATSTGCPGMVDHIGQRFAQHGEQVGGAARRSPRSRRARREPQPGRKPRSSASSSTSVADLCPQVGARRGTQLEDGAADVADGGVELVDGRIDPLGHVGPAGQPGGGLQLQSGGEQPLDDHVVQVPGDPLPVARAPPAAPAPPARGPAPARARPARRTSRPASGPSLGEPRLPAVRHHAAAEHVPAAASGDEQRPARSAAGAGQAAALPRSRPDLPLRRTVGQGAARRPAGIDRRPASRGAPVDHLHRQTSACSSSCSSTSDQVGLGDLAGPAGDQLAAPRCGYLAQQQGR